MAALVNTHHCKSGSAGVNFVLASDHSLYFPRRALFFTLGSRHGSNRGCVPRLCHENIGGFIMASIPGNCTSSCPRTGFLGIIGALRTLRHLTRHRHSRFGVPVINVANSGNGAVIGR